MHSFKLSKKKRFVFASIIIAGSFFISLVFCEAFLRFREHSIQKSNHLDDGMILYDDLMGWRLAHNWKGYHKHYDFNVAYSTNRYGFRGKFQKVSKQSWKICAFVGDSFTFGLGVNDDETFVHLLNATKISPNICFNFSIPGFSTDQEYLLIKEQVIYFKPDVIYLVVYLGNDLFDNELPFPLQANHGKPFFKLTTKGLVLRNTPVPLQTKTKKEVQKNLMTVVYGKYVPATGWASQFLNRFAIFRLFKIKSGNVADLATWFEKRFDYKIKLFFAIIKKLEKECDKNNAKLSLILMPGKSYVQFPQSYSAAFQEYLRNKIVIIGKKRNIAVFDLASRLRRQYQKHPAGLFYPHEGHLTPEGHKIVAEILGSMF